MGNKTTGTEPTVDKLCEAIEDLLHRADAPSSDQRKSIGALILAIDALCEIVKLQEQRTQQAAQALNELADAIGYPINSTREMRARVRAVAAVLTGEKATAHRCAKCSQAADVRMTTPDGTEQYLCWRHRIEAVHNAKGGERFAPLKPSPEQPTESEHVE